MSDDSGGTYTFLFTDIEGSTTLNRLSGQRYPDLLARHHELMRTQIEAHDGMEIGTEGDSFFVIFRSARQAVEAALASQLALNTEEWGDHPVRVRMGLHTGEAIKTSTGWVGLAINQAARIEAAANGSQILLSDATASLVNDRLPDKAELDDLGPKRLKDIVAPVRLFQVRHPDLPAGPPPRTMAVASSNLPPSPPSSFVGRDEAVAELATLVGAERLVTLTGPGGAGKTRLALEVARRAAPRFEDGVWLVELAPLTDPELVPAAVTTAIGARPSEDGVDDTLERALSAKRALVILDNCEHVIDAAAKVTNRILQAGDGVVVLTTSREPLGNTGERVWRVPALPTGAGTEPSVAARLFLDRARSAGTVVEEPTELEAVERVCERLDGLPLALELAAACCRLVSPTQLEQRLHERFRLLSHGARTAPDRHQTLRATVDWSHELLPDTAKTLFRRLAVFGGDFDLEAAEAVVTGDDLDVFDVLDLLGHLVDTSLVTRVEGGGVGARYALLETIRAYASERLAEDEPNRGAAVVHRHADWYRQLARASHLGLQTPAAAEWANRLEREHDNVRIALGTLVADRPDEALEMVGDLLRWWKLRGHIDELDQWATTVLEASADAASLARARILASVGLGADRSGEPKLRARRQAAWEMALATGDRETIVMTGRGWISAQFPDTEPALPILARMQEAAGDDDRLLAEVTGIGAAVHMLRGDMDLASECVGISVDRARRSGDPVLLLHALRGAAGLTDGGSGDGSAAEEAAALALELGDRVAFAEFARIRSGDAERRGDLGGAVDLLRQAAELYRQVGYTDSAARAAQGADVLERAMTDGDAGALAELERVADAQRAAADPDVITTLLTIGETACRLNDLARARAASEELITWGDRMPMIGFAGRGTLAEIALYEGDVTTAARAHDEMAALSASLGGVMDRMIEASRGDVYRRMGDCRAAAASRRLTRDLWLEGTPMSPSEANLLTDLAADAEAIGRPENAATLFGAVDALRDDESPSALSVMNNQRVRSRLVAAIGEDAVVANEAIGASLSSDERAALAEEVITALEAATITPG